MKGLTQLTTGVQHVGIPTNDLEATLTFYQSLGFAVALRTVNEAAGEAVAFLQLKNLMLEVYENKKAAGVPGAIDHIALDVTDIEAAAKEIQALGYPMLEGSVQSLPFWENGVKFFTIAGPNGEKIEWSQKL